MKTSAKAVLILIFLLLSADSFAVDTASARYFPLKVGNSWTYYSYNQFMQTWREKFSITKDTLINGKKYFYFTNYYGWVTYDSLTGNLIAYKPGLNCSNYQNHGIIDSLPSSVNDQINCNLFVFSIRRCIDTGSQTVFGVQKEYKEFSHDGLVYERVKYAKDFGIVSFCSGEPPPCSAFSTLIGCVIDGVVYGDTSLTYVEQIGNSIPDKFELKQNYPNPFNPATNIKFSIPKSGFVNLKIYDVNGKEVSTLVNESLQAGEYQTVLNASSLSSGIYFYTLKAGEFIETKRMILVK